jgi:hypothetical protein
MYKIAQITEDGTHTRITKDIKQLKGKNWEINWELRAVPHLCVLYPGICLTTEEKARKNLS